MSCSPWFCTTAGDSHVGQRHAKPAADRRLLWGRHRAVAGCLFPLAHWDGAWDTTMSGGREIPQKYNKIMLWDANNYQKMWQGWNNTVVSMYMFIYVCVYIYICIYIYIYTHIHVFFKSHITTVNYSDNMWNNDAITYHQRPQVNDSKFYKNSSSFQPWYHVNKKFSHLSSL